MLLTEYYDKVYKATKYDFIVNNDDTTKAYEEILNIKETLQKLPNHKVYYKQT